MSLFTISFLDEMSDAPYDVPLFLLFKDGSVHVGTKTKVEWFKYMGTRYEQSGFDDFYEPYGVGADYHADCYFNGDPIGWAQFGIER